MLQVRYFTPAAPLRQWVSSYYLFETDALVWSDLLRAELPQIRFFVAGTGQFAFGNGAAAPVPRAVLTGPTMTALRFQATGPLCIFGVGLLPAGWAALVGAGADELTDSMTDLSDVAGPAAYGALDRMLEAENGAAIAAAADAFFLLLSSRAKPPPLWFTRAADAWLANSTNPDVNDLIAETGMSARQIERLALKVYGASPKMLARKYRTLQAAVRLGLEPAGGWEAAAGGVFYDQSHFIRDFKTFVGMTPSRFTDEDSPWMARLKIAKSQKLVGMPDLQRVS
ncbi:helix-turn-helix domain-containing protein [Sandaracinobacteroides saxicola]|uniref:Helix-turn-helix domain-containing protein n=1 Tax=Sandaracinobacteroides saxicola TaxID=2759707 RepID=A0A7G5IHY6_9SPHN|nr:helix-turn-helix domain-containing protein [Sandaracinobacteroides saxicola]QMW22978.1 helix-turn-helix domain-containing protein [Sandaracinobacteroides saxicola]